MIKERNFYEKDKTKEKINERHMQRKRKRMNKIKDRENKEMK